MRTSREPPAARAARLATGICGGALTYFTVTLHARARDHPTQKVQQRPARGACAPDHYVDCCCRAAAAVAAAEFGAMFRAPTVNCGGLWWFRFGCFCVCCGRKQCRQCGRARPRAECQIRLDRTMTTRARIIALPACLCPPQTSRMQNHTTITNHYCHSRVIRSRSLIPCGRAR